MSSTDQHAVFVTLADGSKHRVTAWVPWTDAIDTWSAMDDQRRVALKDKGVVAFQGQHIRHYEVRSAMDPAYSGLPWLNLTNGFRVYSRQYTSDIAAAKAVLKPLGYYSRAGGWIYYKAQQSGVEVERVLTQGWWQAAQVTGHSISRLRGEPGYRGTVTTSLQVKVGV